jgi:hypothetical protein
MGLRYAIKEICAYGPKRSAREDERVCPSGKSGTKISPYSVYERGTRPQWSSGEIGGRGTLSFREQNTVGFHRANQMAALLLAGIKNTGVGVPASTGVRGEEPRAFVGDGIYSEENAPPKKVIEKPR